MKKYKVKTSVKITAILIIALIVLIFTLSSCDTSKSYSLEYNIDNYDISENYDINRNLYYYQITSNKQKYDYEKNFSLFNSCCFHYLLLGK